MPKFTNTVGGWFFDLYIGYHTTRSKCFLKCQNDANKFVRY